MQSCFIDSPDELEDYFDTTPPRYCHEATTYNRSCAPQAKSMSEESFLAALIGYESTFGPKSYHAGLDCPVEVGLLRLVALWKAWTGFLPVITEDLLNLDPFSARALS